MTGMADDVHINEASIPESGASSPELLELVRRDQRAIFDALCRPIVEGFVDGYNGTIFAYGSVHQESSQLNEFG